MPRRPPGSREVRPSREALGERRGPSFGPKLGVSVPISFGLPLIVVGLFLVVTGVGSDLAFLWIPGALAFVGGVVLFASGKRL